MARRPERCNSWANTFSRTSESEVGSHALGNVLVDAKVPACSRQRFQCLAHSTINDQIGNERASGEDLALDRDWQRRWFIDPRILDYFEENEIEAIRYDEAEVIVR